MCVSNAKDLALRINFWIKQPRLNFDDLLCGRKMYTCIFWVFLISDVRNMLWATKLSRSSRRSWRSYTEKTVRVLVCLFAGLLHLPMRRSGQALEAPNTWVIWKRFRTPGAKTGTHETGLKVVLAGAMTITIPAPPEQKSAFCISSFKGGTKSGASTAIHLSLGNPN